ncbi:cytochrome c oxidase subunit II [Altererythrobacter sp. B11]|uniref:cytochrome c oxidase subunit II n=1 Tax=Altererythrobacter sp. B11 TaxID=2060312 RepID=UPI000DC71245|nr:cytochrome c oxidase subunit II [Altererythrobacter sp. B11]BBC71656.1 cytochrome c oxidase subunit II [Altererythrobacter sp. B11]
MIEALWGWPPPVLDPAGPYAERVTVLAWALLGMGLVVTGVVLVALWVAIKGPPQIKRKLGGERTVWIGGIAFPGLVLTGLLVWGLTLTAALTEDITGDEMRIRVTGEMWWFRVDYLDSAGNVMLRDANEIHLPVGRPVVFELKSADVIHSFWVPHLSGKKDMIPGRTNLLRVQADKPGRYGGVCAEYCGAAHALMGFVTVTHEPAEWSAWLAARRAGGTAPTLPEPAAVIAGENQPGLRPVRSPVGRSNATAAGRQVFMDSGCAACHRVQGTEANGLAGPDLTHVGSRLTLGAGILPNNRGTLIGWIGDSQSIKPGNRMPSYPTLSAEELGAIATWLETQK